MTSSTVRPAILPAANVASRSVTPKYAGTVMTTRSTGMPLCIAASSASVLRMSDEISGAVHSLPCARKRQSGLPMFCLTSSHTRSGSSCIWPFALRPTSITSSLTSMTTDGVI
ncbi:MAG: hypothetical protein QOJ29_4795 [Thermoleophilaceae bacterium]|nr:hypothetical protein [Thermoleophilaceae bacterium]